MRKSELGKRTSKERWEVFFKRFSFLPSLYKRFFKKIIFKNTLWEELGSKSWKQFLSRLWPVCCFFCFKAVTWYYIFIIPRMVLIIVATLQMFEKQLNLNKWKFFLDDCLVHAVSLEKLLSVILKIWNFISFWSPHLFWNIAFPSLIGSTFKVHRVQGKKSNIFKKSRSFRISLCSCLFKQWNNYFLWD